MAARQAGALFVLAGVLAVVGAVTQPARAAPLLGIAAADLVVAAVSWPLPWSRWHRWAPLALSLPGFAILAVSTWAFGGTATGTGPFFVLFFAWAGLHLPPWCLVAMLLPAALAYEFPLVLTDQPEEVVASGVVLLPVSLGIGLVICRQAVFQRRVRDEVRRVEQWRAALMATLAHDVRSPLTSVQVVLETLQDDIGDLPPLRRERMLAAALRQTNRIRRLAAGLLDADRVETTGRLRLDLVDLGLRAAVEQAAADLNTDTVLIDVPPELRVRADAERLEQILVNLLTNAMRHGAPPVVVRAHRNGPIACITVRDHGPGVSDSHREQLFARFGSASNDGVSVGLGLWIVRELARAHGGDVEYTPADPGAAFTITLPLAPDAPPPPAALERPAALPAPHRL